MKRELSFLQPIEIEILEFVQSMAKQMEDVSFRGQSEVRNGAENYAKAYRTVERHIIEEINIRRKIKQKVNNQP